MDFSLILDFVKKAVAALLALLGVEVGDHSEFESNVEAMVSDVVDFGKDAAAE